MLHKIITTFVIVIFLVLAIAGLEALSGGSSNGAQEISHNMAYLTIPTGLACSILGGYLLNGDSDLG